MNESDETIEIPKDSILQAIENLSNKFDNLEKNSNIQFEAIREGIAHNSAAFDRLEAKFHDNRSDTLRLRADVKDLTEEIRRIRKDSFV